MPKYRLSDNLRAAVSTLDGPSLHLPQIQMRCEPEHLKMLSASLIIFCGEDVLNMFTHCMNMHFFPYLDNFSGDRCILTPGVNEVLVLLGETVRLQTSPTASKSGKHELSSYAR